MTDDNLTPTEKRLLTALNDGQLHHRDELAKLLNDELSDPETLRRHICNLRKKLAERGMDIVCVTYYKQRRRILTD